MRALDRGESFVVTRSGVAVGELSPRLGHCGAPFVVSVEGTDDCERPGGRKPATAPSGALLHHYPGRDRRGTAHHDRPGGTGAAQDRLQRAEATFDPVPVDAELARASARVYTALAAAGRKARGRRALDLLIAATALAADQALYTRNPEDFGELTGLVEIVAVPRR